MIVVLIFLKELHRHLLRVSVDYNESLRNFWTGIQENSLASSDD